MMSQRIVLLLGLLFIFALTTFAEECSAKRPCATGCCSKDGFCGTTPEHCGEGCLANCDFKLGCDANNPCEKGCCNDFGFCGHGPDFCGEDVCVNNCDRKSECDPGFGSKWAESSTCPLNVCCSDFGFCGTTKEFCGNKTVKHKTCSKDRFLDRVVGYYEGWSTRRPCNPLWPEQIPLGVYSHINFAFATIDPKSFQVLPADNRDKNLYARVTDMKKADPNLKVLIALGGWTFNDPGPTATVFSDLASSEVNQRKFFKSLNSFLSKYGFDGVDLDWEYPEADDRNGKPADYKNFPKFMANLKNALDSMGRGTLSITLPASYWYLQHFDLKALAKHVSFFNIMTYDMHGLWDQGNEWTGSYLNAHTNLTEIKQGLELLWRNDVKSDQVVMGLAFYGRTYTTFGGCVEPGCEYASGGLPGRCSHETGILLNNEVFDMIENKKLKPKLYKKAAVKVVTWDDQWVSIDDEDTLAMKTEFAREQCLSGVMVWAISHDTRDARFSRALGKVTNRQVSMQFDQKEDDGTVEEKHNYHQCRWTNCGEACPTGWSMIERADSDRNYEGEPLMDDTFCEKHGYRSWCCPPDERLPTCGWYSHNNGNCQSGCPSGMTEIGSTQQNCKHGDIEDHPEYQSACCSTLTEEGSGLQSMALYNQCEWSEDFPKCDAGKCPSSKSDVLVASAGGSGDVICGHHSTAFWSWDDHSDDWDEQRKYCCDNSNKKKKWANCDWHNGSDIVHPVSRCWSDCPDGQVRVAMNNYDDCRPSGARSYCCDAVQYSVTHRLSDDMSSFRKALLDWTTAAVCASHLPRQSNEISTDLGSRDAHCEILPSPDLEAHLSSILRGYLHAKTEHWATETSIWNDGVENIFSKLVTKSMLPWVTSENAYPEFYRDGYNGTARKIIQFPDSFNSMIGSAKPAMFCTQDLCDYGDEFCVREDESMNMGETLSSLIKRAKARKEDFTCKDENGNVQKLLYTRFAYPGASEWPLNSIQARQAIVGENENRCSNTRVIERQAQPNDLVTDSVTRVPYINTEHLIEIKLIKVFMAWSMEECEGIDCSFFVDFFGKEVISNAPRTPGSSQNLKRPIDRVMEQLGSKSNKDVFRLLRQSLNVVKGDLWNLQSAPGPEPETNSPFTWANLVQSDNPRQALSVIRETISVYNYQNLPNVQIRFKMVNNGIRDELKRTQEAYKEQKGKEIQLVECWDRFFKQRKDSMVQTGKNFVTGAIEQMRERWAHDEGASPAEQDEASIVREQLDELKDHIDEIYMDDLPV